MKLYQYKIEHYGKKLANENPSTFEDLKGFCVRYVQTTAAEKNLPGNVIRPMPLHMSWETYAPTRLRRDLRGTIEPSRKFILLIIDKKIIKSSTAPGYEIPIYKVQTNDPYSENIKFLQYWVREKWIEPLIKNGCYEADLKQRLLQEIKQKKKKSI